MRTTVKLDDALVEKARRFSGIKEKPAPIEAALIALVETESARRLVRLEGSLPDLEIPAVLVRRLNDPCRFRHPGRSHPAGIAEAHPIPGRR